MKRKLTPVVMFAALAATLTLGLTPPSAEAGRVPSREERQRYQERSYERPARSSENRREDYRRDDNRRDDRSNYQRRDDGNINRAISTGSSRGRVLDTRPSGSNYVVRVQTPDGRRVDLTVDGRTGRVISER